MPPDLIRFIFIFPFSILYKVHAPLKGVEVEGITHKEKKLQDKLWLRQIYWVTVQ